MRGEEINKSGTKCLKAPEVRILHTTRSTWTVGKDKDRKTNGHRGYSNCPEKNRGHDRGSHLRTKCKLAERRGSVNCVVLLLWSTKYTRPVAVFRISQPGGSGPSSSQFTLLRSLHTHTHTRKKSMVHNLPPLFLNPLDVKMLELMFLLIYYK